jgi:Lrp/AsnC family leucine-responsive transcriptional regulator
MNAESATGFQIEKPVLDKLNVRLLTELSADPRLRTTELARRLGVSAPTVRERVTRLEESGVIRGYRLEIDPAAVGLPIAAWVRLRPGPGQIPRIIDLAARTPEVVECHRISGEDCFLIRVQVAAIAGLEDVLDKFLVHGQTTSSFIVSTPVESRNVPLPGS